MKTILISIPLMTMLGFSQPGQAESVKFVQWWDKYVKEGGPTYRSLRPNSVQHQDVNQDGVYDDAVVWYPLSLKETLNPLPPTGPDSPSWHQYRIDRPSAPFYGGMIGRYTNVSHFAEKDKKGNQVYLFDHFGQASVQKSETTRMCSYSTQYPYHTIRGGDCPEKMNGESEVCWGDMTLAPIGGTMGKAYNQNQNIETNLTGLFIWKKQDFINGGARVEKVIFDETSKLSVDFMEGRIDIEEVRFIVQDGDQLWISEAAAVTDEAGKALRKGIQGMEIDHFKGTFSVKLTPKNSRWAIYNPAPNEEEVNLLVEELKKFIPDQSSAEEEKQHQDRSQKFLREINKIELNPQQASFIEHTFENVQAVGLYGAIYQFSHPKKPSGKDKLIWFAFENFQTYAAGLIPERNAIASNTQGESIHTDTTLTGGISVNCGSVEQTVRQCLCDRVDIQGDLTVDNAHVGQRADIIVYAIYKPAPESMEKSFYMLDKNNVVHAWDENPSTLVAFQEGVTLQSKQPVSMYSGSFILPGFLQIFFGYRLSDGTLVVSQESIDTHIFPVVDHPGNEKPYCEAVKEECPLIP